MIGNPGNAARRAGTRVAFAWPFGVLAGATMHSTGLAPVFSIAERLGMSHGMARFLLLVILVLGLVGCVYLLGSKCNDTKWLAGGAVVGYLCGAFMGDLFSAFHLRHETYQIMFLRGTCFYSDARYP